MLPFDRLGKPCSRLKGQLNLGIILIQAVGRSISRGINKPTWNGQGMGGHDRWIQPHPLSSPNWMVSECHWFWREHTLKHSALTDYHGRGTCHTQTHQQSVTFISCLFAFISTKECHKMASCFCHGFSLPRCIQYSWELYNGSLCSHTRWISSD